MANEQNLTPFPPGTSGNPKGKKKGTLNLRTLVIKMAEDEKLAEAMFKRKPSWWDNLDNKHMASAIVGAMMMKAAGGDAKAARWFRESGWGNMLNLMSDDKPLVPIAVLDLSPAKPTKRIKRKRSAKDKPKAKRSSTASKRTKS